MVVCMTCKTVVFFKSEFRKAFANRNSLPQILLIVAFLIIVRKQLS